jgi:phosphatidylethanolamine/phosphatidyl-N-methylethanolamine N-methyltransferase
VSALTFLREFVRDPVQLGAVAPSGGALARRMVEAAALAPGQVVVELGAGTGPMTQEILRVRPAGPFVALEPNAALAAVLRARFPTVRVEERKAQDLPTVLAQLGWGRAERVVSSLPFAIWPESLQREVFDGILAAMAPGSRFVTFGYAHARPLPAARRLWATLNDRFEEVATTRIVWRNLPPALVYCCAGPKIPVERTPDRAEGNGGVSS